jgi:hypothetical protein
MRLAAVVAVHLLAASHALAREQASFDVVYTGATKGTSVGAAYGAKIPIHLLWDALGERKGSGSFERTGWALRHGESVVFDPGDFRTERAVRALGRRARPRVLAERMPCLESDHVIVFQHPPNPKLDVLALMEQQNQKFPLDLALKRCAGRLLQYRAPGGQRVLALDRSGSEEADALAWRPGGAADWELWWGGRGYARLRREWSTYYVLVKLRGYGPRRARYVESLRKSLAPGKTLLVSAGDEVDDGESGRERARAIDFVALGALGYTAIVPGARELYHGVAELQRRAREQRLPLVATNLSWASEDKRGREIFPRYLTLEVDGVRVAVLGFVTTDLAERVADRDSLSDVAVEDPVQAAARVLTAIYNEPSTRPDFVIALSNLRDAALTQFLATMRGITVFIGDFTRAPAVYPAQERIDARDRHHDMVRQRSAVLEVRGSPTWVGQIGVRFSRRPELRLEGLSHRPRAITPELPVSEWLHRRVMSSELRARGKLEAVLIPSLEEIVAGDAELQKLARQDPEYVRAFPLDDEERTPGHLWFTPQLFSNVVASLVREATAAEVAIVRAVPYLPVSTPGAVLREYVLGWASTTESLHLYDLTGAQLKAIVQLGLDGVVMSGVDGEELLVNGRDLADGDSYRVAMGSAVAATIARLLGDATPDTKFVLERGRARASSKGRVLRLRDVVLAALEQARRDDPRFSAAYRARFRKWLAPGGREIVPLWILRAESLTFSFSNHANLPGSAWRDYPGVRETRVVTPNSYTLGLKGALSATYDSARFAWETRGAFELARTVIFVGGKGDEPQILKSADDIVASTELRLKLIGLDLGSKKQVSLVPYFNVAFDTEFTPTQNLVTGETYPHQKELLGGAGIVTYPGQTLQEVRLGGLVRSDFAATRAMVDGGLTFGTRASFSFWRARFGLGATLRYFFPRKDDTEERLGLIVQGEAKLEVAVVRSVGIVLGADLFLFRPKVMTATDPATNLQIQRGTAASVVLSAGVSVDRAWKL